MTFNITMKTPDCLDYAIQEATQDENEQRKIRELCSKWFEYGECVTLIVDTDKNTCRVAGTPEIDKHFIICYDGSPLVTVDNSEFALPSQVLDWYAKNYDFDRFRLSYAVITSITYKAEPCINS